MTAMLLASGIFSGVFLIVLCLGDPKRRRSARQAGLAHGTSVRRVFAGISMLPGLYYALAADAAAFLIWFGCYAVAGWLVTLCVAGLQGRSQGASDGSRG